MMYEDILGPTAGHLMSGHRVALFMSGGVDSTILYHALRTLSNHLGFDLAVYTVENVMDYGDNVALIRQQYVGLKSDEWIEGLSNGGRLDGNIDAAILNMLANEEYHWIFTGATQNPPDLKHEHAPKRPNAEIVARWPELVCPFIDKTKDYVFSLYQKYDLMHLYAMTHSCTGQKVGECGSCFQCVEKLWAEQQNGYVRPS